MEDLKFDKMEDDTTLAVEFLKRHEKDFEKLKLTKSKLYTGEKLTVDEKVEKMRFLANKLDENLELFTQLETLKRAVPREDTKRSVTLMAQNLRHNSYHKNLVPVSRSTILMGPQTSLLHLEKLSITLDYDIECCDSTLGICYLFTLLASESGLCQNVVLKFDVGLKDEEDLDGCIGVVTEKSDVYSAVDNFLGSSTCQVKHPWSLRRVLVQESAYDRFKAALSSKHNLQNDTTDAGGDAKLSSNTFAFHDQVFLCDYVGPEEKVDTSRQVIFVEAYRTIKELLSMMKNFSSLTLSLWSSDVSEANEIAYGVNVPVVWINDYGSVDGPMAIADALLVGTHFEFFYKLPQKLEENIKKWMKMSFNDRAQKLIASLDKFPNIGDIKKALSEYCPESKGGVDVQNGKQWVIIENVNPFYFVWHKYFDTKLLHILCHVLRGTAIIYSTSPSLSLEASLFRFLESEGLPFHETKLYPELDSSVSGGANYVKVSRSPHTTRAICTTFGSIFAN